MTAAPSYFTVTANYASIGSNAPALPTVTFTPNMPSVASSALDQTLILSPVVAQPDATGALSVQLLDNQNLNLAVGALTWRVDQSFPASVSQPIPAPFRIAAPGNGATVDLDDTSNWLPL